MLFGIVSTLNATRLITANWAPLPITLTFNATEARLFTNVEHGSETVDTN